MCLIRSASRYRYNLSFPLSHDVFSVIQSSSSRSTVHFTGSISNEDNLMFVPWSVLVPCRSSYLKLSIYRLSVSLFWLKKQRRFEIGLILHLRENLFFLFYVSRDPLFHPRVVNVVLRRRYVSTCVSTGFEVTDQWSWSMKRWRRLFTGR